jgi:TRAP-type C4-dicarboxylate transport system permease small subunit
MSNELQKSCVVGFLITVFSTGFIYLTIKYFQLGVNDGFESKIIPLLYVFSVLIGLAVGAQAHKIFTKNRT